MPKSKRPAAGRAQSFDPRYARKKQRPGEASTGKPGSRSPKHRGHRAAEADAAPKRRWTAQEKAGRDAARGIRTHGHERGRDDERTRPSRSLSEDAQRFPSSRSLSEGAQRPRRNAVSGRPRGARDDERAGRFDSPAARSTSGGDRPRRAYDDRPRRNSSDSARSRPYHADSRPAQSDRRSYAPTDSRHAASPHADVVHDKLQAQAVQAEEVADATFASLGLGDNIVRTLADLGAETPFPIQAATIGPILEGKDVLARGRTGSGKTIAFGAPLVESILRSQAGQRREFGRAPKALILAPTRELALQLDRTVQPIARSVGLFTTQIYGGVPQARQVGALKKGVDIVIGTPGRIEDLHEQGRLDLSEVRIVVLDEADHMSELGFLEPMQRILRSIDRSPSRSRGSQKLMFSATLDREVAALVDEFLVDPAVYEVAGEDQDSGTIDHRVLVIDHRDKAEILASLVDREGKTLVFSRTRAYAEMLAEQFDDAGIRAVALHGDLNQAKRTRNLQRLTSGRVNVLVATDVAARGIHVDDIDLVIQADAPDEYKTYLHRSGRTGRAGRAGTVVSLIPRQRRRRMAELLDRAEIEAPFDEVRPGDDLLHELAGL